MPFKSVLVATLVMIVGCTTHAGGGYPERVGTYRARPGWYDPSYPYYRDGHHGREAETAAYRAGQRSEHAEHEREQNGHHRGW